jgi:hypothetical protein
MNTFAMKNQKRTFIFLAFTFVALIALGHRAYADDTDSQLGLFPNAQDVFRPLYADPRELQTALRLTEPVGGQVLGDISIGTYFGLYRWALPWQDSYVQWSAGGGIFSRFNLATEQTYNEVIDYSANMPVDLRVGKWSTRLMPYHISSHLGDGYIERTGILPQKYSFDSFKWLLAYEPDGHLRFYGGYNYVIRNCYADLGRSAVQTGAEWTSSWWAGGHAQMYWYNDFQSWERVGWNPEFNSQLGVRIAHHPKDAHAMAFFTEYGAGHMAYGQFFQQEESHWILGVRFEIL